MQVTAVQRGLLRDEIVPYEARKVTYKHKSSVDTDPESEEEAEDNEEEEDDFDAPPADFSEDEDAEDLDPPDETILADFDKYVKESHKNFGNFSKNEEDAIALMSELRPSKASLRTYEAVMLWHFRATKKLQPHEGLADIPDYISRSVLFKRLMNRYNLTGKVNLTRTITLPSSRAQAKIVVNDAHAMIQSLLTDPRIVDEDYLFFDDDPLAPPPNYKDIKEIGDINTGLAYIKTYEKLIKIPGKQVLLPVIFYIDGAATGQFAHLPVTALKFTLGIFHRKARERPHMWRTLGYLPVISKDKSRGRRKLIQSGHVDGMIGHHDLAEHEGMVGTDVDDVCKAQDMHSMLALILEDFVKIQNRGFVWDLMYKGKEYKSIEFVPFVPFIKCDTEEADRLVGKYLSRTKNVSQLCRYCCCPTQESDQPNANYGRKTVPMIRQLIEDGDLEGLKELSQQLIDNAMYALRFGMHNEEGVHCACLLEMLHALLLGLFRYTRDGFFDVIGENSRLADEINALAIEYGVLFGRQSDRDMPKTKFSSGIQQGKLMAKEYTGVLLIIAAILRSTEGRNLLKGKKRSVFGQENGIEDWTQLIETLLLWESWLKSDVMTKHHVRRAQQKHRYIMYLMRRVVQRTEGMGLKITKFHAVMHMAQDIIHFGVPMNFDTGSDESGHKPSKTAAKVTQKRMDTFDAQVAQRLTEVHLIDLAKEEIENRRPLFGYFDAKKHPPARKPPPVPPESGLGGGMFAARENRDGILKLWQGGKTRRANCGLKVERPFTEFVAELSEKVAEFIPNLLVRTTHRQKGVLYRGSCHFSGGVWRDWVMVNWGEHGLLPNKVWGFVNLTDLPENNEVECGGLYQIPPGLYAIVESASVVRDKPGVETTELFTHIVKEVGKMEKNRVVDLKFYLADVEAFHEPIVVIPDIGGAPNSYFMLRGRSKWKEIFMKWLDKKYENIPEFEEDCEMEDKEDVRSGEESPTSEAESSPSDDEDSDD